MDFPKWHCEVDIFRKIKPCIVLEGNILDRFHYNGEPASRIRNLSSYLLKLLSDAEYKTVVFYSEGRGFFDDGHGEALMRFAKICGLQENVIQENSIPCSFCVEPQTRSNGHARPLELGTMLDKALKATDGPVAVILDMASRYIVSPDQLNINEVSAYTNIQRALRTARSIKTLDVETKNIVIMLCNKANDLPAWFYLGNPDVKTVVVPTPDSASRMEFVSGDNLRSFFDATIWAQDGPTTNDEKKHLLALQKRFVGLTDGFSFSDLLGMKALCRNEHYRVKQLADVVELYRYGIKENKWAKVNKKTVEDLEKDLRENVFGQDISRTKVLDVVKRSMVQKHSSNRPKGVLFFAGPTGTGKTETAKVLARNIFGDERCLIRFDMSEYRQDQSDQKLLGAPPGYVGYESGGQLTNAVKSNPFSILLFDEIEKAHPSILDKFLQILDDGRLTDGQGNTVYFSECIIIFTSNLGIYTADEYGRRHANVTSNMSYPDVQQRVRGAIEDYFNLELARPEILNRIGESNIVVFDYIRPEIAESILIKQVDVQIASLQQDANVIIDVGNEAINDLLQTALTPKTLNYGGRGIRDLVWSMLYTPVTRYIADNEVSGKTLHIKRVFRDISEIATISVEED